MHRHVLDRLGWGIAGAATVTLVMVLAGIVSAGSLDPSGPPSSPSGVFGSGTPISSLPFPITAPGSYYLTGNLTGVSGQSGITIASNDVSLDLRGFTLQGVPGSGSGVKLQSPTFWRAITVRNGTARGWGDSGFQAQFTNGGVFDSLTAEGNGLWGIVVGGGSSLSHCSATNNGASGINAFESTVSGCTALWNAGHGFQINTTVLTDCIAAHNTYQGVDSSSLSRIDGCNVSQNQGIGIKALSSEVVGNKVSYNSGTGIEVSEAGSLVARNNVHGNSQVGVGFGINVPGSNSRIDENHVTDDGAGPAQETGINVTGAGNVVIRNTAHANVANYAFPGAGGSYGPLSTAGAATNPFSNIDY